MLLHYILRKISDRSESNGQVIKHTFTAFDVKGVTLLRSPRFCRLMKGSKVFPTVKLSVLNIRNESCYPNREGEVKKKSEIYQNLMNL